jgi:hypothetical protein
LQVRVALKALGLMWQVPAAAVLALSPQLEFRGKIPPAIFAHRAGPDRTVWGKRLRLLEQPNRGVRE